ncbi:MAG: histidinol dehydrogenase [Candidatus Cyclobacteriaceae bacterium M3_2C_046]
MKIEKYPARKDWDDLLKRPVQDFKAIKKIVKPILKKVERKGDKALKKFAEEYDHVELKELLVSRKEIYDAEKKVPENLKEAIHLAKSNIEKFHMAQLEEILQVETQPGVHCQRKSVAIQKVGIYIPGGTAPLFSSVLMMGIPANIAGCEQIVLCSPPDHRGKINEVILYTANLIGIDKVVKVGGAQAIGALAFGTDSVPKVYKIFGPGNQYVTAAKQIVNQYGIAIDMPAGPSEVAILADKTAPPAFVAADLLSQAEHGVDSQVLLVSTEEDVIKNVKAEIKKQLNDLPRKEMAKAALDNSKAILVKNKLDAMDLLNNYGPEHLILSTADADAMAEKVKNAGSVFIGNFSPESAGDYASGTNHVLPTNGYAKAYSGVSLDSFMKKITFQKLTKQGIQNIGKEIEIMAEAEQLIGHKMAVSLRLKYLQDNV